MCKYDIKSDFLINTARRYRTELPVPNSHTNAKRASMKKVYDTYMSEYRISSGFLALICVSSEKFRVCDNARACVFLSLMYRRDDMSLHWFN